MSAFSTGIESQATRLPEPQHGLVVINPVAGNVRVRQVQNFLSQLASSRRWCLEIHVTTGHNEVSALVRQKVGQGVDFVIVIGGDGTLSEVATGLVYANVPLAILPLGTGNVVAQELGLPLDVEAASRVISGSHCLSSLDVMQVDQRVFVSHISLGLYALVAQETSVLDKRRFGRGAYLWNVIRKMRERRAWRFDLWVDDQPYLVKASMVLLANAGAVGLSSLRWGHNIRLDDGQIDLCVVKGRTLAEYAQSLWHMSRGDYERDPNIWRLPVRRRVSIRTRGPLPVRADGEIIGHHSVEINILPKAIQIVRPLDGSSP